MAKQPDKGGLNLDGLTPRPKGDSLAPLDEDGGREKTAQPTTAEETDVSGQAPNLDEVKTPPTHEEVQQRQAERDVSGAVVDERLVAALPEEDDEPKPGDEVTIEVKGTVPAREKRLSPGTVPESRIADTPSGARSDVATADDRNLVFNKTNVDIAPMPRLQTDPDTAVDPMKREPGESADPKASYAALQAAADGETKDYVMTKAFYDASGVMHPKGTVLPFVPGTQPYDAKEVKADEE